MGTILLLYKLGIFIFQYDIHNTVKPVYDGPAYSGNPVYYGHRTTSQNFQLPYIFCKVDLYIAVILHVTVTLHFPRMAVVHRFDYIILREIKSQ